jgi:hypothetical protein
MEKKFSTQTEKELNWLKNEIEKDKVELEKEKKEFIDSIKNAKKEDIIQKEDKLTLWKRIKRVLTGY